MLSRLPKRPVPATATMKRSFGTAATQPSRHLQPPGFTPATDAAQSTDSSTTPHGFFSYGAFVAAAQACGRPLTRKERQAALKAQVLAQQDSWSHQAAGSIGAAINRVTQTHSGPASFAGTDRLSATEKRAFSYGQCARAARTSAERVSQVQAFLDKTRESPSLPASHVNAVSAHAAAVQPKAKRGYTWSNLAGRSSFSYGEFVAQSPGQNRAESRQAAIKKFFNASSPLECASP